MNSSFIKKIAPLAEENMKKNGILASVVIAQAILESNWGKSSLTRKANALFGIKADKGWNGKTFNSKTFEIYDNKVVNIVDTFRAYDSWEQSIQDHSAFLLGIKLQNGEQRYRLVIGEYDYKKACEALQKSGYATALNYADALIKIIEQHKLNQFDIPKEVSKQYYIWAGKFTTREDAEAISKQLSELNCYNEIREIK